jgi:hypothetical protein
MSSRRRSRISNFFIFSEFLRIIAFWIFCIWTFVNVLKAPDALKLEGGAFFFHDSNYCPLSMLNLYTEYLTMNFEELRKNLRNLKNTKIENPDYITYPVSLIQVKKLSQ